MSDRRQDGGGRRENAADILGIGAQKSATSWAAHVLNLHPDVWIPTEHAHSGKEVDFFSSPKWDRGIEWYRRIMTPPRPDMKSMDVSPTYARMGDGKIRACHAASPTAGVFFLLRNPIQRDWSSLVMQATRRKFPIATASFVDIMVFYDAEDVSRFSHYDVAIERWRRAYADRLLVALYDQITQDGQVFFERLCRHVGLNVEAVPNWKQKVDKRVFEGPGTLMPEQMYEFLQKKYRGLVGRLGGLIDDDVTHWLDEAPTFRDSRNAPAVARGAA